VDLVIRDSPSHYGKPRPRIRSSAIPMRVMALLDPASGHMRIPVALAGFGGLHAGPMSWLHARRAAPKSPSPGGIAPNDSPMRT
jgi:hypothetical protein